MGTVCMAASSSTSCVERTSGGGVLFPPPLKFRKLVQRIREEFDYYPGLRVTAAEAARFWGLDGTTSREVLKELWVTGFLVRDAEHRYVSSDVVEDTPLLE